MISSALEYKLQLDELFACYMDSVYGYNLQLKEVCNDQESLLKDRGVSAPTSQDWGELDNQKFKYEFGEKLVYRGTVRDHKWRNWNEGRNAQWASKMFVVTAYELWDSHYRAKISEEKGLANPVVQSNSLGDLRHYRNFILHCGGVADKEANNLKTFKWVNPGENVKFTASQVLNIIESVQKELESL